jgi:hypothetical protein
MRFPRAVAGRLAIGFALTACGRLAQQLSPIAVESYPPVSRQPIARALTEARDQARERGQRDLADSIDQELAKFK